MMKIRKNKYLFHVSYSFANDFGYIYVTSSSKLLDISDPTLNKEIHDTIYRKLRKQIKGAKAVIIAISRIK